MLPAYSPYHVVWERVMRGEISLCVNTEILLEYEERDAGKNTDSDVVEMIKKAVESEIKTASKKVLTCINELTGILFACYLCF